MFLSHLKSYILSPVFRINLSALIITSLIPDSLNIRGYIENLHIKSQIESYWEKATVYHLIGGIGLSLLCLSLLGKAVRTFAQRYWNSLKISDPPLLWIDSFLWFAITLALFVLLRVYTSLILFVLLSLAILTAWFLRWLLLQMQTKSVPAASTHLLADNAIESINEDLLGRDKFVENLYQEITGIHFAESFVFGLSGSWGEGKTSVINLLKLRFKTNTDFLTIDFDPWYYKDEDAIIRGFYQEVERAIRKKFIVSGLKKTIGKYLRKLSPDVSSLGVKLKITFDEESLDQIKKRIEEYIIKTKKKILIFVDDIDRLQPAEMLFVFKLVRLSARFKNTFFLLSYDELTVTKYLEEAMKLDPDYLEKIIQKPISLPNIEQNKLDIFLLSTIEKFLEDIKIPQDEINEFRNTFKPIYKQQVKRLFSNLRDVKRYLNGLLPAIPQLKGEVDLVDYCTLEVIRLHFNSVYKNIGLHPWLYVKPDDDLYLNSPLKLSLNEGERRKQIKEHIESLVKEEREGETLLELLGALFEEVRISLSLGPSSRQRVGDIQAARQISNPQAFKKYFLLKVPQSNLPLVFVEERINAWLSATSDTVEALIEQSFLEAKGEAKLIDLFKTLMFTYFQKISPELAIPIIRVLYKNSGKFAGGLSERKWYDDTKLEIFTEYGRALHLLMKLANEKLDERMIQRILEEAINNSPYIAFSASILNYCLRASDEEYYRINKAISLVKIKGLMLMRYLNNFIERGENIFGIEDEQDRGLLVFQWGVLAENDNNKLILKGYMFSQIKDKSKDFVKFLKHYVGDRFGQVVIDIERLNNIYGLSELIFLANSFINDVSLIPEEKTIIEQFLRVADETQKPES